MPRKPAPQRAGSFNPPDTRARGGGLCTTQLRVHPNGATLQAVDASSPYGDKHIFRCTIATPDGRDPCIRTVWQKQDGDFWLVTAYPFD